MTADRSLELIMEKKVCAGISLSDYFGVFTECFENPALCTGLQKELAPLSRFIYVIALSRKIKPPVSLLAATYRD